MKIVIQRVSSASLKINQEIERHIEKGIVVFLGIHSEDNLDDIQHINELYKKYDYYIILAMILEDFLYLLHVKHQYISLKYCLFSESV